ncbi:MAG: ABC transporter ATP-binding protein [Chloroflexi bacterium]|nr:ABC transporter ATP-binding protein [Chloroflexota bacterium]
MTAAPRDLPPWLPSLVRSLRLGFRAEPRLLVVSFLVTVTAAVPDALFALWLKLLADGVLGDRPTQVLAAAVALGASAALSWFLQVAGERVGRRFRERATIVIETHVASLQASVASIEHHERPEYLDRLAVLRDQIFAINHLYASLFGVAGWVLRLGVTLALLMSIHPALAVLAVFAAPSVIVASARSAAERRADERTAPHYRLARHLFVTGTTAAPGKEVRVAGIADRIAREQRREWERRYDGLAPARWATAAWQSAAWALFGVAYVGAIVFVASGLRASAGEVLLVVAAGGRLSQYLGQTVGEIGFLRGIWLDAARKLAWLEDYAAAAAAGADLPVPARLERGIRLEGVSFAYPGTDRLVLEEVDLELPAGAVVAIVGENGAGKTTLVKLLCRLYEPARGRITVDGADLARLPAEAWRERVAGAFQDFARFEFRARQTVGLGDLVRIDDAEAVAGAVDRAGAGDVVARLRAGLDTQLGPTWREGVDVSYGQWQKLALARGFMREHPLLLVLDEPTAALDAESEHALFERYAAAARAPGGAGDGRVTVLVSHRFSTVRMADLIVVLDGARVVEVGTHEALVARGGQYAQLYAIQAGAYR